ncbi:MAG: 1-acyl-sn-glycerol-3-phosphate acyltransferase [Cellulosilyticum sp.]|nr:1-acyl-sn-glycerol-3-phosphate acyltransferase [Cellulosilyticum sp.]
MMRTIYWYVSFVFTLIGTIPKLNKVKRLEKQGKLEERDAYIHKASTKWMLDNIRRSGSTVEVIGTENLPKDETVVFISNHQGNFDIPLLMSYIDMPKGFISKIEAKKIPIIVQWMELIHCVFMDRSTLKGSAGAIIEGIKVLKAGHSLIIFPEGTRSRGDQMGEFKHASFKLATKPGVPIVPVTIDGSYKVMEQNHNKIRPAHIKLTIHPVVTTKGLSKDELEALPDQVAATIASALPNN